MPSPLPPLHHLHPESIVPLDAMDNEKAKDRFKLPRNRMTAKEREEERLIEELGKPSNKGKNKEVATVENLMKSQREKGWRSPRTYKTKLFPGKAVGNGDGDRVGEENENENESEGEVGEKRKEKQMVEAQNQTEPSGNRSDSYDSAEDDLPLRRHKTPEDEEPLQRFKKNEDDIPLPRLKKPEDDIPLPRLKYRRNAVPLEYDSDYDPPREDNDPEPESEPEPEPEPEPESIDEAGPSNPTKTPYVYRPQGRLPNPNPKPKPHKPPALRPPGRPRNPNSKRPKPQGLRPAGRPIGTGRPLGPRKQSRNPEPKPIKRIIEVKNIDVESLSINQRKWVEAEEMKKKHAREEEEKIRLELKEREELVRREKEIEMEKEKEKVRLLEKRKELEEKKEKERRLKLEEELKIKERENMLRRCEDSALVAIGE